MGAAAERRIDRVDGPRGQRDQRAVAALTNHREHPMATLDTKIDDIDRARFGYSQPVQGKQAGKGVVAGRSGLGRGQEPHRLFAVKAKRLRITRHRRATNVGDGGVGERSLLNRVAVEAAQGSQSPGHGGSTTAGLLQLADIGLDVASVYAHQPDVGPGAPGMEVAHVGQVGGAGAVTVTGEESASRCSSGVPISGVPTWCGTSGGTVAATSSNA
jgi:hypothetical protein